MGVPTLVQQDDGSTRSTLSTDKCSKYIIGLPHAAGSGNLLIVAVTWGDTTSTCSITDNNGGNTWNAGPLVRDTTNVQSGQAFYAMNVASSTQSVTATLSAQANFVTAWAYEYYNVATSSALDGSNGHFITTSSTSVTPGSITTTVDGDLIWHWATGDHLVGSDLTGAWSAQSGFNLIGADTLATDVSACQNGIQSVHGAINPTLTSPAAIGYISIQMAFKAADAGTAPSGMRVNSMGHRNTKDETAASRKFQFPCASSNNLLALAMTNGLGSPSRHITAITDTNSNTWTQPSGSPFSDGAGGNNTAIWYASGATCSEGLILTLTIAGSDAGGNGETYLMHAFSGASSSPFDSLHTTNGTQTVTGSFTGDSITPSAANGIVLSFVSVAKNNVDGVSTNTGSPNFTATVGTSATGWAPPVHADEDNGYAVLPSVPASAVTFTWAQDNAQQTGVGAWANMSVSFLAAPTAFEDDAFSVVLAPSIEPVVSIW